MAVVIPTIIGQGWERHEFKFKVNVLPNCNSWQLFEGEPHPRNKDLIAQWCVQAESKVSYKNALLLKLSSKVLCQNRKNVFATVYIHLGNSFSDTTLHRFCRKGCYSINHIKTCLFTSNKNIPLNTTIFATIISETGEKPGFTDILLSDVKVKYLTEKNNYCHKSWGYSHDFQEPTNNGSSSLYICYWEKFMYIFHSLKPKNISAIIPNQVISDDSIRKWGVRLKSEIDHRSMTSFLVLVQLFWSIHLVVFVKVMYVVNYKGRTIQKFEQSYHTSAGKTISYKLENIQDVQDVVVKVSIVSDTGNHFREVHLSSPSNDGRQIENQDLDQPYFKEEHEVPNVQAKTTMQEDLSSSGPLLSQSDPSDKDQLTEERKSNHEAEGSIIPDFSNDGRETENQVLDQPYFKEKPEVPNVQAQTAMQKDFSSSGTVLSQSDTSDQNQLTKERESRLEAEGPIAPSSSNDGGETENQVLDQPYFKEEPIVPNVQAQTTMQKDFSSSGPTISQSDPFKRHQLTKKQKSNHESEGPITANDLIGNMAGPSSCSYEKLPEVHLSNGSEFSEARISSSSQQDKRCEMKLSDVSMLPEMERLLDLEKWKERDHKYSVSILERFLYLYSIRMVAESSSVQQYLHHKNKPEKASSSWNVEMESSICDNGKLNIRILATLKKSKISVLFARMLIFVYSGMDQAKYSFEKKQCLCVGESILEDLQAISITTTTSMVEIVILSENPDRVLTSSCKHNIDAAAGSDQSSIRHVFIKSSTDVLESDLGALSDCSPILRGIIQNFDSEDEDRVIRMTDFSSEVVQSMLTFVNGAKEVCWKRKRTEQVFKLSNKYGISKLKDNCELHLATLLNAKNALKLLIFAMDNSAKKLKNSVLKFVSSRSEYFRENNRYSILQRRPEIMQWLLEQRGDNRISNRKRKNDTPGKEKKKKKKQKK